MPRTRKYHAGSKSSSHPGLKDFTSKMGDLVHHIKHHYVRRPHKPYARRGGYHAGTRSATHKHDKDFTSKRGSTVHHIRHHDVKRPVAPFAGRRRKGGFAFLPFLAPLLAGLATGATSYGTQKALKKVAGGRRRKIH